MNFAVDKHQKYVVLKLEESNFTDDHNADLKSQLISLNAEGFHNMVLDLSAVKEINDSQDLSSLQTGKKLCKKAKGLFIITGINNTIKEILKISNLNKSLNIVGKLEEAADLIFMEELEKELLGGVEKD
ncbi:MAG: STAS domain-containing protein [Pedobacter sp.]